MGAHLSKTKKKFKENTNSENKTNNIKDDKENIKDNNYITAEIEITDKEVNKKINILSSYDDCKRKCKLFTLNFGPSKEDLLFENEKSIKECIEIKIDEQIIPFSYTHSFSSPGKYKLKYSFNNYISRLCYLFFECKELTSIDLSHFNSKNVTNMQCMFEGCHKLESINLTNFNTEMVNNMRSVFNSCWALKKLDLSSFNTQNVKSYRGMFQICSALEELDLSNFNMNIESIDISYMFSQCRALKSLNISNFKSENISEAVDLFFQCYALNEENVICNDRKILSLVKFKE